MRKNNGFTLTEILTVIAIISIMLIIATPNVLVWLANHRLRAAALDTLSNFHRARMTAIKENYTCSITFHQDVDGVEYDYVVFVDPNSNLILDTTERIIAKVQFKNDYQDVELDTNQSGDGTTFNVENDDGNPAFAFKPNGLTRIKSGTWGAGTVFLKNNKGNTKSIVVSKLGNIRME